MWKSMRSKVFGLACLLAFGAILMGNGGNAVGVQDVSGPLTAVTPHLVTSYGNHIYQYRFIGGIYQNTWTSGYVEDVSGLHRCIGSGDLDNDGALEVYAVSSILARTEVVNRKTTQYWYTQKLSVFESGTAFGGPVSWESDLLEAEATFRPVDCIVADADGVPGNELVVLHGSHVDVYDFTDCTLNSKRSSAPFNLSTFSMDVGDADNCGQNEIVVSVFTTGAPKILKLDGTVFTEQSVEPCTVYGKGFSTLALDYAKVRDCDNLADGVGGLKGNEIVGGGNNSRLMVWKHNPGTGRYDLIFVSANLGYFTQGVDAGDINGDGLNEIVIGNASTVKVYPYLWIFAYDGGAGTFSLISKTRFGSGRISGLEVGNADADSAAEVVVAAEGMRIFDFAGTTLASGTLVQTYFNPSGGLTEIR